MTEPCHDKTYLREFPTRSHSNWPAQPQKLAWGLKFWLQKLETLHYLGSEQQRRRSDWVDAGLICAFVVRIWHTRHILSWPSSCTVIFLSFRTDRSGQTAQADLCLCCSHMTYKTHFVMAQLMYHNFPKFLDRQVWVNSADPDQRSSLIRVHTVCNSLCIFWMHYSKE